MDLLNYPQGELARILNQFLLKTLHIILDSRVFASRPSNQTGEVKKSDKWFNLVLGDRPSVMDSLSFWNRSLMEPMVIDIILIQESRNSSSQHASGTAMSSELYTETVIERWTVQYEHQKPVPHQTGDPSYKRTYKKSIILLRSVYSMLRLLPAHKAFRKLKSLSRNCDFDISYKVCSFSTPFSRAEEASMKKCSFIPVDAQQGRLSMSVMYRNDLSDFNLDVILSCPPDIIPDYVGSPLADPMREFPSTSFAIKGKKPTPSSPLQRPHSWTSGLHQDAQNQRLSCSPPSNDSQHDHSSPPTGIYIHRTQSQRSPAYHRITSDDILSPPFSPSSSPSTPSYLSGVNPVQGRLRSETVPMSIPHPMMARTPRYLSPNLSDPHRNSLPPPSPRIYKHDPSSHESPKSIRKHDLHRAGELSSGSLISDQKVSRDPKGDSGRFSSALSSSSSPRVGFSRTSSKLSFQEDFGDVGFSCPFIVDGVDPSDSQASQNLDGQNSAETSSTIRKSQDAAVGALVHMLKTAPPLHQDSIYHYMHRTSKIEVDGEDGAVSEFFKPRKASDAIEELKVYSELKDLLLSKSLVQKAAIG